MPQITPSLQHVFLNDACEEMMDSAVEFIMEEIDWMDDEEMSLSRAGRYLTFLRRSSLESVRKLAQLQMQNVSVHQGKQEECELMEGNEDNILNHVKKSCPKLGELRPIASWSKYTLVFADGTHFIRINLKDGSEYSTDYYYFSHLTGKQQDELVGETLPSSTTYIIAKCLPDTQLYRDLGEEGQILVSKVDKENQARMHFLHLRKVLEMCRDGRVPQNFSTFEYDPESNDEDSSLFDEQVAVLEAYLKRHPEILEQAEESTIPEVDTPHSEDPTAGTKKLLFVYPR